MLADAAVERQPSGELPRAHLRRRVTSRCAARASRRRSRVSCLACAADAVVAHMCPIYAVLAAPLVRPLRIPLVLWFTHWRASALLRAAERASTAVDDRRRALVPVPLEQAPGDRARHRPRGVPVLACARRRAGLQLLALGRYSTGEGARRRGRGGAARRTPTSSCTSTARPSPTRSARIARSSSSSSASSSSRARRPSGTPFHDARSRRCSRSARRAREQHARRRSRQGRLRGGGRVSAGARLQPDLRRAARPRAALPALGSERARRPDSRAGRAEPRRRAAALGRRLRERVAAGHSVQSWARGILDAARIS